MKNKKTILERVKYLGAILILLSIVSCKTNSTFTVKVKVLGKESGTVRLSQYGNKASDAQTTSEVIDGEFCFEGETELPEEWFVCYQEDESSRESRSFVFFVEPSSETKIVLNIDDIDKSEIDGSEIGNEYHRLKQERFNKFESKMHKVGSDYEAAYEANDEKRMDSILEKASAKKKKVPTATLR